MVTEYAEGDLYQILDDDKSLPEEQVCIALCFIFKTFFLSSDTADSVPAGVCSVLSPLSSHPPSRHEATEHTSRQGRHHQAV